MSLGLAVAGISTQSAQAAALIWDADNVVAGQIDGAGAWLGPNQWFDGANNVTWADNNDAVFGNGGVGGAVTLSGPVAPVSITFNSFTGTYTLGAIGGPTITIGSGMITKNTGSGVATINSPVVLGASATFRNDATVTSLNLGVVGETGGSRNILKTGPGQVALAAASTYTGTTTIEEGNLNPSNATSFGTSTSAIALGNANTITNNLSPSLLLSLAITIARDITVGASNAETFGTYTIGTGNAASTPSGITGTVTLNQSLIVSAANLQAGRIFSLSGSVPSGSAGTKTVTFNNSNNASSSIVVSAAIGGGLGTIAVTKGAGTGTTIFTGANTYTGETTINVGGLQFTKLTAMSANSAITVNGTLIVNAGGANEFTNGLTGAGTIGGLFAGVGAQGNSVTLNPGSAVGIDTTNAGGALTYAGNITNAGLGLVKLGAGTLTLTGVNTYTGGTIVNGGTVSLGTSGTLGALTGALAVNNPNTGAATNVVLNLASAADTTVGSLSGAIAAATPAAPANTGTINNGGSGRNFIINQTVANNYNGVLAGAGNLVIGRESAAILGLGGANTYTGTTTIENGGITASTATALGNGTSAIALGSATSISESLSPTLLVNGATTLARNITVGASNAETFGTYTIGTGNAASAATINGSVTLNQSLTVSATNPAGNGLFTLAGSVTSGSLGTQTVTFNTSHPITASTVIGGGPGVIAVTKMGAGTTTLTAAETYTGPTTVNEGTLIVQGSIQGTGIVNVNFGNLGGTGSIAGVLNVGDAAGFLDAIIAPGAANAIGTLTSSSAINFASDAQFNLQINSDGTPSTDLLTTTGAVTLGFGVATLNVAPVGNTVLAPGTIFTFLSGSSLTSGGFFADLPDGTVFPSGVNSFEINYTTNSVQLIAVPEPGSAAILLGGLGTLLGVQRSRRGSRRKS